MGGTVSADLADAPLNTKCSVEMIAGSCLRPEGAADSSPGRQAWVAWAPPDFVLEPRRGDTTRHCVAPSGLHVSLRCGPRACALGYCLPPLRGEDTGHRLTFLNSNQ